MKTVMARVIKVTIFSALTLSLLIAAAGLYFFAGAGHLLHREFLSISEVCQSWGDRPLDVETFWSAEADEPTHAAIACSLLKNQADYVGMRWLEIGPLFGDFTGYYDTETQPTYLIERAKTKADDTWQIVFLIDQDRKVAEIVVHKNCC